VLVPLPGKKVAVERNPQAERSAFGGRQGASWSKDVVLAWIMLLPGVHSGWGGQARGRRVPGEPG
jgi:hypothetical protein